MSTRPPASLRPVEPAVPCRIEPAVACPTEGTR
jgi:hypothetical protein